MSAPPPAAAHRDAVPAAPPTFHWLTWLASGAALWAAAVAVLFATGNTYLIPTVVLLGSFTVPAAFVVRAHERYGRDIGTQTIVTCFAVGGVIGVLGASVLEHYLLHPSVWMYCGVALIEEAVKAAVLVLITRRLPLTGRRTGLVLGAAVGFGFAAFETAGYALDAAISVRGLDLRGLVETEALRGVLAPVGHGLWTGLLGAVLFEYRLGTRFTVNRPIVLTFLGVSALHAFWDSTTGIAVWLTALITTGTALSGDQLQGYGYLDQAHATPVQTQVFNLLSGVGLVLAAVLGLLWLRRAYPAALAVPAGLRAELRHRLTPGRRGGPTPPEDF
ncbi:PrsW family intramembrane metalloprotease [Phaeacidiphilus oryzae]|uniref:PrsW family intramembrane metalloprotease n=1 Tax=Phaeacidiphilus oryzae TaxID=348818 RepID=UPI0007C84BA0|nr:PrsW family glutamic-type intramembrane protease [Phaeacidiphilus oryzae]